MSSRRHLILLRVTDTGYIPVDETGQKQHAKLKLGQTVSADIARGRSVVQNSLYWSVLTKVVATAPGAWRTAEALHEVLKVATGHIEIVKLIDGRLIKIPESTAFNAMTQDAFQTYLDAAFRIIQDEILGGMSIDELMGTPASESPQTDDDTSGAMAPDELKMQVDEVVGILEKRNKDTYLKFTSQPKFADFSARVSKSDRNDLMVRLRDASTAAALREP